MILAYCPLHYGATYLGVALEAIYPQVDKIVILYTEQPSQGFNTLMPCPDSKEVLQAIVEPYKDKLIWHEGHYDNEGDHNNAVYQFTDGYDWMVRFDSDEIYQPGSVKKLIKQAEQKDAHIYRVPFLHFWRSFNKVCRDGQMPDRIINLKGGNEPYAYLDGENETTSVLHMGYAQATPYIVYKMEVSGHKSEWRPEWLIERWTVNAQVDVHPVVFDFWSTEDFSSDRLPQVVWNHPNFGKEIIQ